MPGSFKAGFSTSNPAAKPMNCNSNPWRRPTAKSKLENKSPNRSATQPAAVSGIDQLSAGLEKTCELKKNTEDYLRKEDLEPPSGLHLEVAY